MNLKEEELLHDRNISINQWISLDRPPLSKYKNGTNFNHVKLDRTKGNVLVVNPFIFIDILDSIWKNSPLRKKTKKKSNVLEDEYELFESFNLNEKCGLHLKAFRNGLKEELNHNNFNYYLNIKKHTLHNLMNDKQVDRYKLLSSISVTRNRDKATEVIDEYTEGIKDSMTKLIKNILKSFNYEEDSLEFKNYFKDLKKYLIYYRGTDITQES